jgi:hypothetical protein
MSLMLLGILNSQAAGGGGGAFDLLETTTLSTSAASVTFDSLDSYSGYKHLQIRALARCDSGNQLNGFDLRFNGNSSSVYTFHRLSGDGSSVTSFGLSSAIGYALLSNQTGGGEASGSYSATVTDILDFSSNTKNTTMRTLTGQAGSTKRIQLSSVAYLQTEAITSINLFDNAGNNFVAGSRFSLIGVK